MAHSWSAGGNWDALEQAAADNDANDDNDKRVDSNSNDSVRSTTSEPTLHAIDDDGELVIYGKRNFLLLLLFFPFS
jgi:mannose-1-phosphate guanylyltransferase